MSIDPDRVRARFLALAEPGALATLAAERRAVVVTETWDEPGSAGHHPEPLHEIVLGRRSRRMFVKPGATGVRVGRDSEGRPVIAEDITPSAMFLMHVFTYRDDEVEIVAGVEGPGVRHVEIIALDDGLPVARVMAGRSPEPDAAAMISATRWRYLPRGGLQSATTVWERPSGWLPEVVAALYGADSALTSVERYVLEPFSAANHEAALDRVPDLWNAQVPQTKPVLLWSADALQPPPAPEPAPDVRVADRDELATIVGGERAGLARWGLILEPGGTGISRLGGRPILPEGVPWPVRGQVAMTHLATLAFAELPDAEGRYVLPAAGTLAFFADTSNDAIFDLVDAEPGSDTYMLIFTSPGEQTHEPAAPNGPPRDRYDCPVTLNERRVVFTPRLQLPEDLDHEEDPAIAVNGEAPHQLLGFPLAIQEDPRTDRDREEILLRVGWDEELGFEYLDAGDLTFFANRDDLRAGRWERVKLTASSS